MKNKKQEKKNLSSKKSEHKENWQMDTKACIKNGCLLNTD